MNTEFYTRIKLLKIWEVLLEHSGKDHPLSTTRMLEYLSEAGVPCDRRTLYGDVDVLINCGYNVKVIRERENYYYTDDCVITGDDLYIIAESVRHNGNLNISRTNELVKKLSALSFDKSGSDLSEKSLAPYFIKTFKCDVYGTIGVISDALKRGKAVEVEFLRNAVDKTAKKVGAGVTVSPVEVVYYNGGYYLAYYDGKDILSVPIKNIAAANVCDKDASRPILKGAKLRSKIVEAVCGRNEKITFIADNGLIGGVLDYFGDLTECRAQGADKFSFTVETAVNDFLFGWCASKGGGIKINAPEKVKKEYELFIRSLNT